MMDKEDNLVNKTCIPCQAGTPPLTAAETDRLLLKLGSQWMLNEKGHLHKEYKFKDFLTAMAFANKIATLAEQQGHHPDLSIAWGKCGIEIWTHKINGLSESDFILAAKIDSI